MTNMHFQSLAEAIKELPLDTTKLNVANAIARVCEEYNGHFNRYKFYEACGLEHRDGMWFEKSEE